MTLSEYISAAQAAQVGGKHFRLPQDQGADRHPAKASRQHHGLFETDGIPAAYPVRPALLC